MLKKLKKKRRVLHKSKNTCVSSDTQVLFLSCYCAALAVMAC